MKKLLLSVLLYSCSCCLLAQPGIQWQKCLGGTFSDQAYSIQQTVDSGYIVAGYSFSNDSDVSSNHGSDDFWIVKLNSSGAIQWNKCLGGTAEEQAHSIQQTTDSGFIVAGVSNSNDSNVSGNHGGDDYWIVKLNVSGSILWQKSLGGTGIDWANSIQQTSDGGYIVAGTSNSNDLDVSGNHGGLDYWIVKLNSSGTIQWQKCLGGTGDDYATSIRETTDSGYIVAGYSLSNNGDVSGNHGDFDYWIVKLNRTGSIQWQKCLGGTWSDFAYSIRQTTDGGYIVAGFSNSNDSDVQGNHGYQDYWIVKLNSAGGIQWQKCLGGTQSESASAIQQTNDSGYIVAGCSYSNDSDVLGNHGGNDYWIVKLDSSGTIQWQKCMGGTDDDYANTIQQTDDSGYIIAGYSRSNDGDVTGNHIDWDYWIVKLNPAITEIEEINPPISNLQILPNPISSNTIISFSLFESANISIAVYDITGRLIKNISKGFLNPGSHEIKWNVADEIDDGVYLLNLSGEGFSQSCKLVVVK